MSASRCLERELAARRLALPARLVAELRAACRAPFTGQVTLWERLQRGCAVLDELGGMDAPDALWDRWEALLAAWVCTQEEAGVFAPPRRPRRGGQRETGTGPSFIWHTEKGPRS